MCITVAGTDLGNSHLEAIKDTPRSCPGALCWGWVFLSLEQESLDEASEMSKLIESINGLCVSQSKLKHWKSIDAPGIMRGMGKHRWRPKFYRFWKIDDRFWVNVIQEC